MSEINHFKKCTIKIYVTDNIVVFWQLMWITFVLGELTS
jgi:hypothetical protein